VTQVEVPLENDFVGKTLITVARDLDYPLDHFKDAITDGARQINEGEQHFIRHDRGIDAVIIALGERAIKRSATLDDVKALLAVAPDERFRVLLLACDDAKANFSSIPTTKISAAGDPLKRFLCDQPDVFITLSKKNRPMGNPAILAWFHLYNGLRHATEAAGRGWQPRIDLVFASRAPFNGDDGVTKAAASAAETVANGLLTSERARYFDAQKSEAVPAVADVWPHIYGRQQLADAERRFVEPPTIELVDVRLLPLPATTVGPKGKGARGFIGWMPASRLIAALQSRSMTTRALDPAFFTSNPRGDLGDEEKDNPGGLSLRAAIHAAARRDEIVYGHNGVLIVAKGADEPVPGLTEGAATITLVSPNVVNGRQSCRQFLENSGKLDGINVPIRIVITDDVETRETVSLASNTQAPIHRSDLLALNRHVRAFEEPLNRPARPAERIDFVRLRSGTPPAVADRLVRPDDLVDAFAAAFRLMPHALYQSPKRTEQVSGRLLFDGTVTAAAARALAWLVVAVDRWALIHGIDFDGNSKIARHHVVAAVWVLASGRRSAMTHADLQGGASEVLEGVVRRLAKETAALEAAVASAGALPTDTVAEAVAIVRDIGERTGDKAVKKTLESSTEAVIAAVVANA
jgi:AIPR protein